MNVFVVTKVFGNEMEVLAAYPEFNKAKMVVDIKGYIGSGELLSGSELWIEEFNENGAGVNIEQVYPPQ